MGRNYCSINIEVCFEKKKEDFFHISPGSFLFLFLASFSLYSLVSNMVSEHSTSAMEKFQQTLESSSSSHFVPISFSHSTSIKLENHNFLIWRKQIFSSIRGHNLQHFVTRIHDPPLKFQSSENWYRGIVNQDFIDWEQQDQLLVSWLLSSMSEGVLSRWVNCESAFQIWKTLEVYFASQTHAKISQYKTLL